MSETIGGSETLYAQYPTLFGGPKSPEFSALQARNRVFTRELMGSVESSMDILTERACVDALTATDLRLGRDIGQLGTQCDGSGLWVTLPTFYHNGDGTRAAMAGTAQYMLFVNQIEGDDSPYADRDTYLASLVTAAFDDIVFGAYGRGGQDEAASAAIAEEYLRRTSAPEEFTRNVLTGINASVFDENNGRQSYDPERGAEPVQRASLVGDLWALGTPQATTHLVHLLVENLWKPDSGYKHPALQALKVAAVNEWDRSATRSASIDDAWRGRNIADFLSLAQLDENARSAFAVKLGDNGKFVLTHRYANVGDPRVDGLMHAGKEQNARLQFLLGSAIENGGMTIGQAYRCALAYANAHLYRDRPLKTLPYNVQPKHISSLLLAQYSESELRAPINADEFWASYGGPTAR